MYKERRYYHIRTEDGELLADVELGIRVHNAIHEERFTGQSPFAWLRLSRGESPKELLTSHSR